MPIEWQPATTEELLLRLEEHTNLKPRGRAFKQSFPLTTNSGQHKRLISWKFNEWDYGKPQKIQLPTHARGLFTLEGEDQIVVRGYDKFFNVGEVPLTRWDWLASNTTGPYIVTAKENGCIVFFSGLEDGTIVVCSKHSYGTRSDIDRNHATAGEEALKLQLELKGVTMEHFAKQLYELNCTAVAELCDDSFEEHVVEYPNDRAGLYLHGLNTNKPIFETRDITEVERFAHEFGFKTVDYFQNSSIDELQSVLEESAKTGSYNGRETEGFVIRCHLKEDNADYFFKFKFEEPYLMYRQFREVTKQYITHKTRNDIKINKHKYITNKYLDFVIPLLDSDKELSQRFLKGFGVISLRKQFLLNYGMTTSEILSHEKIQELEDLNTAMEELKIDESTKFIVVPIATIGCGKTTTAMTITNIFPDEWAIVINDDIPNGKSGPTEFVKRGLSHLKEGKRCVVLDRNNHQYRERQQIIDTVRRLKEDYLPYNTQIQFICLNFVQEDSSKSTELWNVTRERVFNRGDNHQSIKAASDDPSNVEKIMKGFIGRFQPCDSSKDPDSQFDLIIDLDVDKDDSSLQNAKLILNQLKEKYPILISEIPSDEDLQTSFNKALDFKPTYTKFFPKEKKEKSPSQQQQKPKVKKPVYYSLGVPVDILTTYIETLLKNHPEGNTALYHKLKTTGRVQDEFHITACHSIQARHGTEREKSLWNTYNALLTSKAQSGEGLSTIMGSFKLKSLIWDDKAMCVLVNNVKFIDKAQPERELGLEVANEMIHITIGTADESIKPFYSNALAKKSEDGEEGVTTVDWDEEVIIKYAPLLANF